MQINKQDIADSLEFIQRLGQNAQKEGCPVMVGMTEVVKNCLLDLRFRFELEEAAFKQLTINYLEACLKK